MNNSQKEKYRLSFPYLEKFDFVEHGFYIQRNPPDDSKIREHSKVTNEELPKCIELKQVHSSKIFNFDKYPYADDIVLTDETKLKGDGIITNTPNIKIAINVADCAPVYLIDSRNRAIALLHCGWRPIADNIIENCIEIMAESFNTDPDYVSAFIGPCIQVDDYEIGAEIASNFNNKSLLYRDEILYLDIPCEITERLAKAGIARARVRQFPISTYRDRAFCSYRRDGEKATRMTAVMQISE